MTHNTTTDTDHASLPDQFADGETIVECYAGGRAGTGKTTQLVEWFRDQHGEEMARTLIDPADETPPATDDGMGFTAVSIDPQHATYKYSVSGEHRPAPDAEGTP